MHSQEFAELAKLQRTDLLAMAAAAFVAGIVSTLAALVLL